MFYCWYCGNWKCMFYLVLAEIKTLSGNFYNLYIRFARLFLTLVWKVFYNVDLSWFCFLVRVFFLLFQEVLILFAECFVDWKVNFVGFLRYEYLRIFYLLYSYFFHRRYIFILTTTQNRSRICMERDHILDVESSWKSDKIFSFRFFNKIWIEWA